MAELWRAYAVLLGGRFRSVAAYRTSFAVDLVTNVGGTAVDLLAVLVLFRATTALGGFTLHEGLIMAGLSSAGFVLGDFTVGNVERVSQYVRMGTMDAVLVRPLGVLPQLLLLDLPIRKALRLLVGFGVYVTALSINDLAWTPAKMLLVVVAPIAAGAFFGAIFVLTASVAFWWTDSGTLGNALTYGGRDFTTYPITVYSGWFRSTLAYGLGFGFVSYEPALALLGRADPLGLPAWAGYVSPLVALAAVLVAAVVWRSGIRHYRSTGS